MIDSSVALAWLLPDEIHRDAASGVINRVAVDGALTAVIFRAEVANALLVNVRRGRLVQAEAEDALRRIAGLRIAIDPHSNAAAWKGAFVLATRHGLSVYDATFLELAIRRALPLATLDARLRRAAEAERVTLSD